MLNFKKLIIVFWFMWWLIALWTDIVGGLSHLGWLTKSWAPDTNYPFLVESLSIYPLPKWAPVIFYMGIVLWMAVNVGLYFHACMVLTQPKEIWLKRAEKAFIISLSLWLCFFLADQMVMKFDLEENHMVQGGFQLLTFLCLYLLPDRTI